jgi:transposase-like protein
MHGRPRAFWEQLVAAVEAGANVHVVAQRHGVNASTLAWWRTVFRREGRVATPRLLPVVVRGETADKTEASSALPLELVLGEATLRVPVGTDVRYVAALARALGEAC